MKMDYLSLMQGTNLFVGAHPDDSFLGAFNIIRNNPIDSIVMTITNGASPYEIDYPIPGLDDVCTSERYAAIRRTEEKAVMNALGVPEINVLLLGITEQVSHQYLSEIIEQIKSAIETHHPSRIFTHEFPQAHPDHEVACFAVHQAVSEINYDIKILEFPLYTILPGEERQNSQLILSEGQEIISHAFTSEETSFRRKLMNLYASQPDIPERYITTEETFRVLSKPRNFSGTLPRSEYVQEWIRETTPEDVRKAILEILKQK